MFQQAARLKLRFPTTRGSISTEDLWDLPLTSIKAPNLDNIAIALNKELIESNNESFVVNTIKTSVETQLRFDIVKHVIGVRIQENLEKSLTREKADKKKEILALIAEKQKDALGDQSIAALTAMLKDL